MFEQVRKFASDARGNIAAIGAVAILPIICLAGAAVDYSRAASLASQIQAGTDAATLALCKSTSTSTTDMTATATSMINNYVTSPATVDNLSFTSSPRSVTLKSHATYAPAFMKIVNIKTMTVNATSACSAGETYYEIALVLDTTGSMASSSGSQTKLQALQSAATNFINYMFDNAQSGHLKISIVPFASNVKVDPTTYANASWLDLNGKSSLHWQNVTGVAATSFKSRFDIFSKLKASYSDWAWEGCLESLPYPLNVQDGAPTASNLSSYYVPYFYPDEVGTTISGSQDVTSNNSYIDDGTSTGSSTCDSNNTNQTTRLGQACKYVTPKNLRTSQGGPNYLCSTRALTRLTASKATLLSEINQLVAYGSTNIHEGVMWGWRTLSPKSVFTDGSAYNAPNTVKIVVLMTDGTNQWLGDSSNPINKSYYSAYGYFYNADGSRPNARLPAANANPTSSDDGRDAIDALTALACTNTKAAGITIYSVGFSVPADPIDSTGQTLLSNCATSTDKYFLASNSTALTNAFSSIAQGIGQLRLTR